MFRFPGAMPVDPAEEKRRVRKVVKQNVASFVVLCAAIRIAPFLLAKVQESI